MELDQLIAALAPRTSSGGLPSRSPTSPTTPARAGPGSLFFCVPGRAPTGTSSPPRRSRTARSRWSSSGRSSSTCRSSSSPTRAPRWPSPPTSSSAARREELQVAGVTGTNGKTTTAFLLYAILDAAGRRPGLLGTIESRVGGERRPAVRTTPEAIDLQRTFREMLDAGDRSCGARGDVARLGSSAGSTACASAALVFTNLTQDHLDFHGTMEEYFEAKRRLFLETRPPAAVNVGDEYGRRLAEELRGQNELLTFGLADDADLRPDDLELGPRGARSARTDRARDAAARPLQRRERARRGRRRRACSGSPTTRSPTGVGELRGVPGRFEAVDEGQPFAVRRRLRAQARLARERPAHGARPGAGPRDLRLRLRRRPRPREAAADGPDRGRARRRRDRHLRQPAQRGARRRSSPRSSPAPAGDARGRARPARGDRAGDRRGRARATSS